VNLEEIKKTQEILRKGGIILFATDTCWAIGCDATNEHAVKQLSSKLSRKGPFVCLIPTSDWLSTYVVKVPDIAWDIVDYSESPLTVIYDKGKNLAPEVMGQDGSIALRVTKDPFCKDLMMRFQKPLVATLIGDDQRQFHKISQELLSQVDYVVPFRKEEKVTDPPSTIMKLSENGEVKFLRKA